MKLFKTVDEKLAEIGFNKIKENNFGAAYERYDEKYKYTQCVDLSRKQNGKHIIQSYDKDLSDVKGIGNTCVGLTYYEAKLFMKKMKKLRLTCKG